MRLANLSRLHRAAPDHILARALERIRVDGLRSSPAEYAAVLLEPSPAPGGLAAAAGPEERVVAELRVRVLPDLLPVLLRRRPPRARWSAPARAAGGPGGERRLPVLPSCRRVLPGRRRP